MASAILLGSGSAVAQPYSAFTWVQPYVEFNDGSLVNNGQVWDDQQYMIHPMPFAFGMFGKAIDTLWISSGAGSTQGGAFAYSPYLADRGFSQSESPISTKVEGASGDRILIIQFSNCGFRGEKDSAGTTGDFANFQIRIYEIDQSIDIHCGTSSVAKPAISYSGAPGPIFGIVRFVPEEFYMLAGDPAQPSMQNQLAYLSSLPANGTVYRFQPAVGGLRNLVASDLPLKVWPNPASNMIFMDPGNHGRAGGKILIFNLLGEMVMEQMHSQDQGPMALDIHQLTDGLYRAVLMADDGAWAGWFVVGR